MEYHGTNGDDDLDQAKLGLPDWTSIYGEGGNDRITIGATHAIGGPGNDTLIGTSAYSTAAYWGSPKGIKVDLAQGTAQDGFGTVDRLINIHVVHGTPYDDVFTGSSSNDTFLGLGGNDSFAGGGGDDTVSYLFVKSTEAQISYDAATGTIRVVKNFASGDHGTDLLKGIRAITFSGEGSDNAIFYTDSLVPQGGFLRVGSTTTVSMPAKAWLGQVKAGDFNGDGKADFYLSTQIETGTGLAPAFIFTGDGQGHFTDATTQVFAAAPFMVVGGGRAAAADFNHDGSTDIFQFDFGNDAPPFAGGRNSLFLSAQGRLIDASATLDQQTATNHSGSVGDVNGDGYADVLANTLSIGNVLYLNDGTGHFTTRNDLIPHPTFQLNGYSGPQTNTSSGMVDVNGDGKLDLILGKWDGDSSTPATEVLLNDGNGNFTKLPPIGLPASGLAKEIVLDVKAIDLNGDARPDLMLSVTTGGTGDAYYSTPYIQLLVNDGGGQFHDETEQRLPHALQATFGRGWFVELTNADFNHDGHPDILAASAGSISSVMLLNRGDGTFYEDWTSRPDERTFAADVNGDGAADLVSVTMAGGALTALAAINQLDNGHIYRANFGGETLRGSAGDDLFISSAGNDTFIGNGGRDTVRYAEKQARFHIDVTSTGATIADTAQAEGCDTLVGVQRVQFADTAVALDVAGNAGQVYRLYQAAFNRKPDLPGLGWQIKAIDGGTPLLQLAGNFMDSPEFKSLYGAAPSYADLVNLLYRNVLHRTAEQFETDFWVHILDGSNPTSHQTPAEVLMSFSESPENQAQMLGVIQGGIQYQYFS